MADGSATGTATATAVGTGVALWRAIEDSIQDWIESTSGLSDDQIIWAQQGGPRPSSQYIAIRLRSLEQIGQDWTATIEHGDGAEFQLAGIRKATLEIIVFESAIGSTSAAAVASRIVSRSGFDEIRQPLNAAGVGLLGFGPVNSIDQIVGGGAVFESRAIVEARLLLSSRESAFATWIETVEVTDDDRDITVIIPE